MNEGQQRIAEFVNVELTSILEDCNGPVNLNHDAKARVQQLETEIKQAINDGNHYPMAALLEIRRIYKKGINNGNDDPE